MKNIIKLMLTLSVLFSLMQLTGCANYQRVPLTAASRAKIMQTHVVVNGVQHHVITHHNNMFNQHVSSAYVPMPEGPIVGGVDLTAGQIYNPSSPGLNFAEDLTVIGIQALNTSYDQMHSKEDLTPIWRQEGKDRFFEEFKHELMSKFTKVKWLHVKSGQVAYQLAAHPKMMKPGKSNNVLFVGLIYALNSHMNQLEVTAYVQSRLKKGTANTPIYNNIFTYIYSIGSSRNNHANRSVWLYNHSALLKSQMKKAINTLSHLIVQDITNPATLTASPNAQQVSMYTTHGVFFNGPKMKVQVLAKHGSRYTLLVPNGEIYSVNKRYLID